jgi:putative SOS response-associated peptidase YedK
MSRRFVQHYSENELSELYLLNQKRCNLQRPRYNIAPTTTIDVVRLNGVRRELVPMRWGFLPTSSERTGAESRVIFNARAETIAGNRMFRTAFKRSRCIVPASGYYEWRTLNGARQPFYFSARDGGLLSIAGVWDECEGRSGPGRLLCTLIVTSANHFTASIHHRMPVLLHPNNFAPWLAGCAGKELLMPAPNEWLRVWRVSKRIHEMAMQDDSSLIEPVAALPPAAQLE